MHVFDDELLLVRLEAQTDLTSKKVVNSLEESVHEVNNAMQATNYLVNNLVRCSEMQPIYTQDQMLLSATKGRKHFPKLEEMRLDLDLALQNESEEDY